MYCRWLWTSAQHDKLWKCLTFLHAVAALEDPVEARVSWLAARFLFQREQGKQQTRCLGVLLRHSEISEKRKLILHFSPESTTVGATSRSIRLCHACAETQEFEECAGVASLHHRLCRASGCKQDWSVWKPLLPPPTWVPALKLVEDVARWGLDVARWGLDMALWGLDVALVNMEVPYCPTDPSRCSEAGGRRGAGVLTRRAGVLDGQRCLNCLAWFSSPWSSDVLLKINLVVRWNFSLTLPWSGREGFTGSCVNPRAGKIVFKWDFEAIIFPLHGSGFNFSFRKQGWGPGGGILWLWYLSNTQGK